MRGAGIPWIATPLTPSLSSEHLSNTVITSWIPSTFLFLHVMPHKPAKAFDCTLPAFNLGDVSCVLNVAVTSLICHIDVCHVSCCITFKDQIQAFGFEPRLQYVTLPCIW